MDRIFFVKWAPVDLGRRFGGFQSMRGFGLTDSDCMVNSEVDRGELVGTFTVCRQTANVAFDWITPGKSLVSYRECRGGEAEWRHRGRTAALSMGRLEGSCWCGGPYGVRYQVSSRKVTA